MFSVTYMHAGLVVRIESQVTSTVFRLDIFDEFTADHREPDIVYRFYSVDPEHENGQPLSDEEFAFLLKHGTVFSGTMLLESPLVRTRLRRFFDRPDNIRVVSRPESVEIYDFIRHECDIFRVAKHDVFFSRVKVEPIIYGLFLPAFSMVMIHSASIALPKGVAVFLAPGGGGKTTVARQAAREQVLSDDHVILRKVEGEFTASATPWGVITNNLTDLKLGGMYLLEQSESFSLTPVHPSEMLEYLWVEHQAYFMTLTRDLKIWLFGFLSQLCFNVPTYRMCFAPDRVDWDAVQATMK